MFFLHLITKKFNRAWHAWFSELNPAPGCCLYLATFLIVVGIGFLAIGLSLPELSLGAFGLLKQARDGGMAMVLKVFRCKKRGRFFPKNLTLKMKRKLDKCDITCDQFLCIFVELLIYLYVHVHLTFIHYYATIHRDIRKYRFKQMC